MAKYHAKKRLGQHFLVSPSIIAKIVDLVKQSHPEHILEIGPGRGVLTEPLVELGVPIMAVEFDRDLIGYLTKKMRQADRLTILNEDILECDPAQHGFESGTIVGNLPYNITTPVIDWCVKSRQLISSAILMMQREVAFRLSASPGSKDWSPLALLTQLHFDISLEFEVPPEAFDPPPKVVSSVILLKPVDQPLAISNYELFERVVRSGFRRRRKQLINNLVPDVVAEAQVLRDLLVEIGLDYRIRAEQLKTEQFLQLTEQLIERNLIQELLLG